MDSPAPPRRSFSETFRDLARGFFEGVGEVALYFDSLPLEKKHHIKAGLIALLSQGSPPGTLRHLLEDDQRLKRLLLERGWWVLQQDITGTVKREILRLGREPEPSAIDDYLCGLFRADDLSRLRTKVNNWFELPYFTARRQIIVDCLEAHKSAQYTLTVPTLLPLLDGMTRAFRKAHLRPTRGKNPNALMQVKQFAEFYRRKQPALWGAPFATIVKTVVYSHFDFATTTRPSSLNRHGILHGEIADYATEANSLKTFLLIDTVAVFVRVFEEKANAAKMAPTRRKSPQVRRSR
jgi:hypothetical protein